MAHQASSLFGFVVAFPMPVPYVLLVFRSHQLAHLSKMDLDRPVGRGASTVQSQHAERGRRFHVTVSFTFRGAPPHRDHLEDKAGASQSWRGAINREMATSGTQPASSRGTLAVGYPQRTSQATISVAA